MSDRGRGRVRVCVVGAGGREHALAVALTRTASVVVTPGNPGMDLARNPGAPAIERTEAAPAAVDADLWVVGPEAPLVAGLADELRAGGRPVLGPGAEGARLEGSKAWMKELLADAGVPTAAYATFDQVGPAVEFLRGLAPPWVVKTDGLAAGKGVLVTDDLTVAEADVAEKLAGRAFGAAGRRVVLEEGLVGTELSLMAVCDGTRAVALAPARDFKRAGDGDTGANTGGMGAYSPVTEVGPDDVETLMDLTVRPTLAALRARGIDYRGVLYAGLMLTPDGPRVIEFNVRFGDPETQAVLPRWRSDVTGVLAAAAAGRLDTVAPPTFTDDAAVTVVLAAEGYPEAPRTGDVISGLAEAAALDRVTVTTAGVGAGPDGRPVTAGGRVVAVTGTADDLAAARATAYAAADLVTWTGQRRREDIALAAAGVVAPR